MDQKENITAQNSLLFVIGDIFKKKFINYGLKYLKEKKHLNYT